MGLNPKKIKLLSDFVDNLCELCHGEETMVGKLQPHRIKEGWDGGKYEHRNIKMLCDKCHKLMHSKHYI